MDTGPAEILLIRPPPPAHESALAGPGPGGQPALAKAAHERASGGQGIGSNIPQYSGQ